MDEIREQGPTGHVLATSVDGSTFVTAAGALFAERLDDGGWSGRHAGARIRPCSSRHVGNAVLKTDARGSRLSKETRGSARKIDLAVAAVMAFDRAAQLKKKRARVINLNALP